MYKELLGGAAVVLTFVAFLPYIHSIHQGEIKPHYFSWLIWGSTTTVVFLAQFSDRGGAGSWSIGISGLITLYVAFVAYLKRSDDFITGTDWLFFIVAMSSLPFWYLTSNPLWAVAILTTVDLLGFGPTFRKSYNSPYEENLTFFVIITLRNIISIAALQHYTITTVLFQALTATACLLLIMMVTFRRRTLSQH